jgi:hypothetical protein
MWAWSLRSLDLVSGNSSATVLQVLWLQWEELKRNGESNNGNSNTRTASQQAIAADRLQLRSFLTPLPAAAEFGCCIA